MMDFEEFLRERSIAAVQKIRDAEEQWLLNFFGSREEAERQKDNFIVEVHDLGTNLKYDDPQQVTLSSRSEYRIRRRLPGE